MRLDIPGAHPDQEVHYFTYQNSSQHGKHIQERLCIDRQAGIFEWKRFTGQKGEEVEFADGGAWSTSMVCNVRFTTKWGDPSKEFLLATQPWLARRREWSKRLSQFANTLRRITFLFLNPMAALLIISCLLTAELWRSFPTDADGAYSMAEPAKESALDWSTALSVGALVLTVYAGRWANVLRCWWFNRYTALLGTRLPGAVSDRWGVQRLINGVVLVLFFSWSVFALVLCPVAKALNSREECAPYTSPEISASSTSAVTSISGVLDPCYGIDGVPLVCGVGACSCGAGLELRCAAPPDPPAQTCRRVPRPLCAGDGAAVEPSGIHAWLLAAAISSAVMDCLLGLCWIMNLAAALLAGPCCEAAACEPALRYHKLEVSLRRGAGPPLVLLLDGCEDPLVVLRSLAPGPAVRRPPGSPELLPELEWSPRTPAPGGPEAALRRLAAGGGPSAPGAPAGGGEGGEGGEPEWC